MSNPFAIDSPTCISFSGGRTSAYMLHKVLLNGGGQLPSQTKVIFCNTGKEEEATLQFVNECSKRWNVPITWLEYRLNGDKPDFAVVSYETASRNGEPFNAIILKRQPSLPNGRSRYCSSKLKTRTMQRYLRSIGWSEWDSFVGIRADEPRRVNKFRANNHPEGNHETVCLPLANSGISAFDVSNFWKSQDFDLGLSNMNGKTMHGNCDLCYLKPKSQVLSLITEKPERATWWMDHEAEAAKRCVGDGQFFAIDRPTYAQMLKFSKEQTDMFDPEEEGISCFCGD
jgi:3'-phosphoadenosine 5'-phosphosulfate sulfotransferase (PAPS reductase)/FAD synthetase